MSALDTVFETAGIVAGLGTVAVPLSLWVGRRLRRANAADTAAATKAAVDAAMAPFDARMGRIEDQFGPNGGGLREAVNNVAADVRVVKQTVEGQNTRFEDHLEQAREDRARLSEVERALFTRRRD